MGLFRRRPCLRQRARWHYELGRLRGTLSVAAYAIGLSVLGEVLSVAPWRCATIGGALTGLSVICCWLGGSAARGCVRGLVLGSGLLVALAGTRVAFDAPCLVQGCVGDCAPFSLVIGMLVGAGFVVEKRPETWAFWAGAVVASFLAVALAFVAVGPNGLHVFAGAAVGTLARWAVVDALSG